MNYQQQSLAVMNGLELIVVLYDGMVRFLYRAIANVDAGDVAGRRESIRRVLEILTYLQARLRVDIGGDPAVSLSEFYAAIYAQCVRASRDASIPLLEQSIRDIMNVRDAWKQVSNTDRAALPMLTNSAAIGIPAAIPHRKMLEARSPGSNSNSEESKSRRWSA